MLSYHHYGDDENNNNHQHRIATATSTTTNRVRGSSTVGIVSATMAVPRNSGDRYYYNTTKTLEDEREPHGYDNNAIEDDDDNHSCQSDEYGSPNYSQTATTIMDRDGGNGYCYTDNPYHEQDRLLEYFYNNHTEPELRFFPLYTHVEVDEDTIVFTDDDDTSTSTNGKNKSNYDSTNSNNKSITTSLKSNNSSSDIMKITNPTTSNLNTMRNDHCTQISYRVSNINDNPIPINSSPLATKATTNIAINDVATASISSVKDRWIESKSEPIHSTQLKARDFITNNNHTTSYNALRPAAKGHDTSSTNYAISTPHSLRHDNYNSNNDFTYNNNNSNYSTQCVSMSNTSKGSSYRSNRNDSCNPRRNNECTNNKKSNGPIQLGNFLRANSKQRNETEMEDDNSSAISDCKPPAISYSHPNNSTMPYKGGEGQYNSSNYSPSKSSPASSSSSSSSSSYQYQRTGCQMQQQKAQQPLAPANRMVQSPGRVPPPSLPPPRTSSRKVMVEICPGMLVELRGATETIHAIRNDFYMPQSCCCCQETIFCIQDADYVLCPDCRVITPLSSQSSILTGERQSGGGVGLGFKFDELQRIHEEILHPASSSSISSYNPSGSQLTNNTSTAPPRTAGFIQT